MLKLSHSKDLKEEKKRERLDIVENKGLFFKWKSDISLAEDKNSRVIKKKKLKKNSPVMNRLEDG